MTNANLADDSVHNDQLASNSVRADEIQANAVGHVEMNDDSVGVGELITSNTPAASQVLGYNGTAMTWVAQGSGGGGVSTFTGLSDTPGTITASECVQGNAAGDALVFAACATGGGGGTDDQTAAEVPVTATGFTGNLSSTDTNVQTALATIDAFTLGGGGGVPGTGEQRIESVTFADVDNITSTATTLTLAATTPIAVEFGDGTAEMLTGTAGETTFTIAASGVYLITFEATYPADGDRATPFVEIQQDSDDAVIGRTTNSYIRDVNSPEDGQTIVLAGVATVPSDALVVKAVLANAYNQNSLDADAGKLSLVRIGTGLRGATGPTGPAGADGTGTTFSIHACLLRPPSRARPSMPSPTTSDGNDRRSASPATTSAPPCRHRHQRHVHRPA